MKGTYYTLSSILGNDELAREFCGGSLVKIFLSPLDYHRFHYPLNCNVLSSKKIGNRLFPQNEIALKNGFTPFDINIRTINIMENKYVGKLCMIEVGAFYVGRIYQTDCMNGNKLKGAEKGYFGLGGSTVILIFKKNTVRFDSDIVSFSKKNVSVKIKMGEKIGQVLD